MKIACVDHSFHKKTRSFDFVRELLNQKHTVVDFWDEAWEGGESISIEKINAGNFDAIVFFQIIEDTYKLKKLRCKNITWLPMYDTEIKRRISTFELFGYVYLNVKIFSLSDSLTERFNKLGFKIFTAQYYPKPDFMERSKNSLKVFFWQRSAKINWPLVKSLLNFNLIQEVIYKNNPDPRHHIIAPSTEDIKKFNITVKEGWLDQKEYKDSLYQSTIYISPREYEGIGMSFLDAMASGALVIAPDKPTMNEYITHGSNGYLYDLKNPKQIDLSKLEELQQNLKTSVQNGFDIWETKKRELLTFIEKPLPKQEKMSESIIFFFISSLSLTIRILKDIKKFLGIKFY